MLKDGTSRSSNRIKSSQVFAREAAVLGWEDADWREEAAARTHGDGGKAAETEEGEGKAGQERRERQPGKGGCGPGWRLQSRGPRPGRSGVSAGKQGLDGMGETRRGRIPGPKGEREAGREQKRGLSAAPQLLHPRGLLQRRQGPPVALTAAPGSAPRAPHSSRAPAGC